MMQNNHSKKALTELKKGIITVDHIGYAVKDIQKALRVFNSLGYSFSAIQRDECQNVNVCIGNWRGGVNIELLSPLSENKSPIDSLLAKNGATPYHICYCVKNISEMVEKLRQSDFLPIGAVAKSEPLGGNVW